LIAEGGGCLNGNGREPEEPAAAAGKGHCLRPDHCGPVGMSGAAPPMSFSSSDYRSLFCGPPVDRITRAPRRFRVLRFRRLWMDGTVGFGANGLGQNRRELRLPILQLLSASTRFERGPFRSRPRDSRPRVSCREMGNHSGLYARGLPAPIKCAWPMAASRSTHRCCIGWWLPMYSWRRQGECGNLIETQHAVSLAAVATLCSTRPTGCSTSALPTNSTGSSSGLRAPAEPDFLRAFRLR